MSQISANKDSRVPGKQPFSSTYLAPKAYGISLKSMASAVFLVREHLIEYREVRPTDALDHVHHSNDSDARVHYNSLQECLLHVL